MSWLIPLVVKSLLVAGGALVLLHLMRDRSAADRSWVAHLALAALLLLPLASLAPSIDVPGPQWLVGDPDVAVAAPLEDDRAAPAAAIEAASGRSADTGADAPILSNPLPAAAEIDWPFWTYVFPAALLVLLTLIALARLFVLKARATVLIDAPWLTALARAQQRMGFKHGTALLTSDALPSPISWGVVRPVILLNSEAAKSHKEAEAIITHELAHVAGLDWAKLMLARLAVALFWFNPLVWMLAREAHQLREEAADDAVLATDIDDTDYARLLVGVARHECRGLLLGAHGVAPARNSLARRVKRVLDGAVARAPGGWRWTSAAAFFAAGMAVPVAALNLVPAAPANRPYYDPPAYAGQPSATDQAVRAAEQGASEAELAAIQAGASAATAGTIAGADIAAQVREAIAEGGQVMHSGGRTMISSPGGRILIDPPNARGVSRVMIQGPGGNVITYAGANAVAHARSASAQSSAVDRLVTRKVLGATPEYARAIRSAVPYLAIDDDDLIEMRAVGVTPEYLREMARSGLRFRDVDGIVESRALGSDPSFVRSMVAAGFSRLTVDDISELKAMRVTAADVSRYRRALGRQPSVDEVVEMKAVGLDPEDVPDLPDVPDPPEVP